MGKRFVFSAMLMVVLVALVGKWLLPYAKLESSQMQPGPPILGIPDHGERFLIVMDDSDTIGSVYKCMDRVHRSGGGTCEIMKGSIKAGRTMRLSRRYQDVSVSVHE